VPWKAKDAKRHTKKAKTPKAQSQWKAIANRMLSEGNSEGDAIRTANGVIKRRTSK